VRILLIEDDVTTIESIKLCLEIYEPESKLDFSNSGLEAIHKLKQTEFDVVIIDLGLPDIDGLLLLEQLRQFSQIPAIILTARHNREAQIKSMRLGANDFITKPFDYRNLLNRLSQIAKPPEDQKSVS
jgi:DNA-binding response OmpR family regulator